MAGGYLAGLDEHAELDALDLRFRYFSGAQARRDIVHVDIDDGSLAELGRWPWPRETLAGLIDTLTEARARSVALDIIMPEPQKVRFVARREEVYGLGQEELIGGSAPVPVFDDMLLARAMRDSTFVSMPMHVRPADRARSPLARCISEALATDPGAGLVKVAADVRLRQASRDAPKLKDIEQAYLAARAELALRRFALPASYESNCPVIVGAVTPPLVTFAQVTRCSGFVTFRPGPDGVVRRIPLLARSGADVWPQFALAVAADELARRHGGRYSLSSRREALTIVCEDGTRRDIPVDGEGQMLIDWLPRLQRRATSRMSAALVVAAWKTKRLLDAHGDHRLGHMLRATFLGMGYASDVDAEAGREAKRLNSLTTDHAIAYGALVAAVRRRQKALLYRPGNAPDAAAVDELRAEERKLEARVQGLTARLADKLRQPGNLARFVADWQTEQAERTLAALDALPAKRKRLTADLAERMAGLSGRVAGKICIVGSTATGAADFVPTPMDPRLPGVEVHSAIVNTILAGSFIHRAHPAIGIVVILAAGALAAYLAASRSLLLAVPAVAALGAAYAAFNGAVVFGAWRVWLAMVAPLAAMGVGLISVAVYRQITEERAKRHIRKLFAHALSPALVDRLLEDPSLAELGGQKRHVSCMFADLQGFTTLSERLGPQRTVGLLNRYFDRVTDVVQNRRGGYLNKFLGDGVFVFFGAPVSLDDHPTRAIHAAVDCQAEVAQLNEALADESGQDARLSVRIGVTAGDAMVGNCGSTERMDYTAIGDCVNLASRLEAANKFFGTRILVDDQAWRQCRQEGLLARTFGEIFVPGRVEPVKVWNVLGAADGGAPQMPEAMAEFTRAVELMERRDFAAAAKVFEGITKLLGDDRPTRTYLELCRGFVGKPADADWRVHTTKG